MADARNLLLGLDAGNTVIKAVLFDLHGNQLAASAAERRVLSPTPGHVERDMAELWANAAAVIRECLEMAGARPGAVAAIGCAGHGNGLYLIDRAGDPLLAIQSLDSRAADLADELRADGNGARLHALCLQEPWPSQTPTLLAWLRRHAPEIYDEAGTAFLCKDYVTYCLTGRRVSDISDMSGAGLIRLPDCRLRRRPARRPTASRTPAPCCPTLLRPTDIAGGVTRRGRSRDRSRRRNARRRRAVRRRRKRARLRGRRPGSGVDHRRHLEHQPGGRQPRCRRSEYVHGLGLRPRPRHGDRIECDLRRQPRMVRARVRRARTIDSVDPFGACNRRMAAVTPAADDPYFHPFLYGSRQGATMRAGFYGVAGWHRRGTSAARAVRGRRLRAPPPRRRAARGRRPLRQRRRSPAAAPAARSGRRCSPTSSAFRSPSPPAPRPAPSAPRSPPASAPDVFRISEMAVRAMTAGTGALHTRPGHGVALRRTLPYLWHAHRCDEAAMGAHGRDVRGGLGG